MYHLHLTLRTPLGETKIPLPMIDPTITVHPFNKVIVFFSSTRLFSSQPPSYFHTIYPSQRQNLLPTFEILIQNFGNFHIFQNFGKKFPNSEFFSKISKTTKGPPLTSKGPPPPCSTITKFSFFIESFQILSPSSPILSQN